MMIEAVDSSILIRKKGEETEIIREVYEWAEQEIDYHLTEGFVPVRVSQVESALEAQHTNYSLTITFIKHESSISAKQWLSLYGEFDHRRVEGFQKTGCWRTSYMKVIE